MKAYIIRSAPREVNLPSPVRDRLLSLTSLPLPPDPAELDGAVAIVYELMNDSLLLPFLESVSTLPPDATVSDTHSESRFASRSSKIFAPSNKSPKPTETSPRLRSGEWPGSLDVQVDFEEQGHDPLTPPTTPPTPDSPGSPFHHRVAQAHSNAWKKVKLGFKKNKKSGSPSSTASSRDDISMSDSSVNAPF